MIRVLSNPSDHAGAASALHVTGAGGWIGAAVLRAAHLRGRAATGLACRAPDGIADDWISPPRATVVHLAAIAHRAAGTVDSQEYRRVNRDLAVAAGRAASRAGARRFVFVSSAAVMGATSGRPWREDDLPRPCDAYAQAKLEAEQGLASLHEPGRFDVVVLRPPLVWGPGVRANFRALLEVASTPWPLPLAGATAPRSMVHLDNVVDAIIHLADAPGVGGRTYFVSDDDDRSVAEWIRGIRRVRGRPARLFEFPSALAGRLLDLCGRSHVYERLFLPARLDISALRATGWRPVVDVETGLRRLVAQHAGA